MWTQQSIHQQHKQAGGEVYWKIGRWDESRVYNTYNIDSISIGYCRDHTHTESVYLPRRIKSLFKIEQPSKVLAVYMVSILYSDDIRYDTAVLR